MKTTTVTTETLTDEGRAWAEANLATSIVARVALYGTRTWPDTHVDAAIVACNDSGAASQRAAA